MPIGLSPPFGGAGYGIGEEHDTSTDLRLGSSGQRGLQRWGGGGMCVFDGGGVGFWVAKGQCGKDWASGKLCMCAGRGKGEDIDSHGVKV